MKNLIIFEPRIEKHYAYTKYHVINWFPGQIWANIDLSLLKIALAALVQILQILVNISRIDQKTVRYNH